MDLQSVFYILAILFMAVGIVISAGILALIIFAIVKMNEAEVYVEKKLDEIMNPVKLGSSFLKKLLK